MEAQELIQLLGLTPLPEEGGYFREVYRSPGKIPGMKRNFATHIYYLVTPQEFSALHRVTSDELFNFYLGDPVEQIQIDPKGNLNQTILGPDLKGGQQSMAAISKGHWQGLKLLPGGRWALLGCTVTPGFEFEDFEAGRRSDLISDYPQHKFLIEKFTHPS